MATKTDVPGYSTSNPDLADFAEAARALRVRPFYEGPELRAVQSFAGNAVSRSDLEKVVQ